MILSSAIRCSNIHSKSLSAHNQDKYINEALQVGARGFVPKDEAPDVLPRAIRAEVWRIDVVAR